MHGRSIRVLLISAAVSLVGCNALEQAEVTESSLGRGVVHFKPDVAQGGVSSWDYEFLNAGSGKTVLGCNSEKVYTAVSWVYGSDSVKVTFSGGAYENYKFDTASGSVESGSMKGRFTYTNSLGSKYDMVGDWTQDMTSKPCTARK